MAYPNILTNGTLTDADEVMENFYYSQEWTSNHQAQQNINILINSAAIASTLNPYDDMYLDIFNVAAGNDGTVNTTNTTATYDSVNETYKNLGPSGSPTVQSFGFTGNTTSTETAKSGIIVQIGSSDLVLKSVTKLSATSPPTTCYLYPTDAAGTLGTLISQNTYSGNVATFSDETLTANAYYAILSDSGGSNYGRDVDTSPGFPAAATDMTCTAGWWFAADSGNAYMIQSITTDILTTADKIVETNAQTITANPIAHQLYCHNTTASTGTVDYDVSFDGGTTWVTGQSLSTYNTSVHAGSSMLIRINLNEGASSGEVSVDDYAMMLYY